MKLSPSLMILASVAVLTSASTAAVYFENFETGFAGGEMNGQKGWSSNGATATAGSIVAAGGPFVSRAGSIGFVNPVSDFVFVSHGAAAPIVGAINASFSSLFQIIDSDTIYGVGAEVRDTFGFRLENAAGENLFSFFLTPFDQDPNPETDTAFHTYSWSTGNDVPTTVLPGFAIEELTASTFTVNFFDAGGGDVGFNANIDDVDFFSGTLDGLADETIAEFGAFWIATDGGANSGSNFMIFDNVTLVPEPSSAMLGLLGASFLLRRRRNA